MNKMSKVGCAILSIVFLICGVYHLHKAFSNTSETSSKDSNKIGTVMIGESASDKDGVEFCVTNVENVKSVGEGYTELKTDNNFVVISVKITNKSDSPYDVNTLCFLLTDGGSEYEYSADALLSVENHMYLDTINPNLSKEYVIVYETATTTLDTEYKLKIRSSVLSNKDNVYIILKESA